MSNTNDTVEISMTRGEAAFVRDLLYNHQRSWEDKIRDLDSNVPYAISQSGGYGDLVATADSLSTMMWKSLAELYRALVDSFNESLE